MTEQVGEQELATIPTEDAGASPTVFGTGDLDIVRIYNKDLDAYGECPRAGVSNFAGWEIVDPSPEEAAAAIAWDPKDYGRDEVLLKLNDPATTDGEREAILALEAADGGKNRKTILEWEPSGSDES